MNVDLISDKYLKNFKQELILLEVWLDCNLRGLFWWKHLQRRCNLHVKKKSIECTPPRDKNHRNHISSDRFAIRGGFIWIYFFCFGLNGPPSDTSTDLNLLRLLKINAPDLDIGRVSCKSIRISWRTCSNIFNMVGK